MKAAHDGEVHSVGIGDWLLDIGCQRLKRDSASHLLNPKEVSVLLHLAENSPDLVPTGVLLDRTWSEVVVGDHVLHEVIGRLRKVLGDSARQPKYIETLRKRGYRVIAPVQFAPARRSDPDAVPRTHTLAVMPFEDLSPSQDLGWLTGRLRNTLLVQLSRIEQLKVVRAPHAMERHGHSTREGDLQPDVDTRVLGSVYPVGDSLILTVQLLDAQSGTLMWAADHAVSGDAEESRVPLEAVRGIETALGLRAPVATSAVLDLARYGTSDIRAYALWRRQLELKFSTSATENDIVTALELARQAVDIDPGYVMGHVALGMTHRMLSSLRSDLRELKHAQQALERAVELGPRHPIALGNLVILAGILRDWGRAVSLVRQAEPWTSVMMVREVVQTYIFSLANLGRWEEANLALDEIRRVMEIDPNRYYGLNVDVAEAMFWLNGDARAAAEILGQDGLHRPPGSLMPPNPDSPAPVRMTVLVHPRVCFLYYYAGCKEEAVGVLQRGLSKPDRIAARRGYANDGWDGMLRGVIASRNERELLSAGDGPACLIPSADLLAALGDKEAMYECLDRQQALFQRYLAQHAEHVHECGPGSGHSFAIPVWTAPPYCAYSSEPRFQQLLDDYGVMGHRNR